MDRSKIKAKAYAAIRKDGKVLMQDIHENGTLIGYRIPGGHVEFGEKSVETVIREMREELNAEIVNISLMGIDENIFVYEGKPGHEITFVYAAEFADKSLYDLEVVPGHEPDNGKDFPLYWIDPHNLPEGIRIFPTGLTEFLAQK